MKSNQFINEEYHNYAFYIEQSYFAKLQVTNNSAVYKKPSSTQYTKMTA